MPTNVFFNNFQASGEQDILESLIVESIKIYGEDCYYLPRTLGSPDDMLNEDDTSYYNKAIMVELYIKSVDGFEGDGNFLSKFGLEIRDQVTFTMAKRTFDNEIGMSENFVRPREGDLIYFPLNQKLFQITFVNNKPMFYPLGTLPAYDLTCQLFEYSNEVFNTGIPEVDDIQEKLSTNIYDYSVMDEEGNLMLTEDGDYMVTEEYDIEEMDPFADNDTFESEGDAILDFTERDPFSEDGSY